MNMTWLRPVALLALCALSVCCCAQGDDGAAGSVRGAVHAWSQSEVIEEISPATLARIAASRPHRSHVLIAADAAADTRPSTARRDSARYLPPAPAATTISRVEQPPTADQALVARLEPDEMES